MKKKSIGFGFNPDETHQHFVVLIPPTKRGDNVYIIEECPARGMGEDRFEPLLGLGNDRHCRVILTREQWGVIEGEVKAEFNTQLYIEGYKMGRWKLGINPIRQHLGKELILLAWAIEDADLSMIPNAIVNWKGLCPEERWWLYTMTNATTGQAISGRGKGWRKAVRYALTEN